MSTPKKRPSKSKKPSKSGTQPTTKAAPKAAPKATKPAPPKPDPDYQHSLEEAQEMAHGLLDATLMEVMERQLSAGIATIREGKVRDPNVLAAALVMLGLELLSQHTGHEAIARWLEELAATYRKR